MTLKINAERWTAGFKDAYASKPVQPQPGDDHSYASGRVEGEALRLKHQQEYELMLFSCRQVRPIPKDQDFD
tara:strand:+ start:95 stop:310 length:216 start_codon:yes stop_codon:yes gene_type:complete